MAARVPEIEPEAVWDAMDAIRGTVAAAESLRRSWCRRSGWYRAI